jgi:hypothetical protein
LVTPSDGEAGHAQLRVCPHSDHISGAARFPKELKTRGNRRATMFREPTYRVKGRRAFERGREFVRTFSAQKQSPWSSEQHGGLGRERNKTSPNSPAHGTRQDSKGVDLFATTGRSEGHLERVPRRCVVLLVPERQSPRREQRVTNEGGLIRFGLGGASEREVGGN